MRIVVGVNQSSSGERALQWAVAEARIQEAEVVAVMATGMPLVTYPLGWQTTIDTNVIVDGNRHRLDAIVDRLAGSVTVDRIAPMGAASEVLLDHAKDADLVVVGTRGLHGVFRWLGSVSDQVVRHVDCPVVVVPETTATAPDGAAVVVGVDGSPNSLAAVRWALDEARARGVQLQAVSVWGFLEQPHGGTEHFDPRYGEGSAGDFLAEMTAKAVGPIEAEKIEKVTVCDLPTRGLVEAADAAHTPLLVIGARGVGGFKGLLLGSVSHKVLATANCPVAVVHGI